MYKSYGNPTPVAHEVWEKVLTLPLYPSLSDEDVALVIATIRKFK
jgi:dTDP-4-amino-4,6-dideoxygalactose transaminase